MFVWVLVNFIKGFLFIVFSEVRGFREMVMENRWGWVAIIGFLN